MSDAVKYAQAPNAVGAKEYNAGENTLNNVAKLIRSNKSDYGLLTALEERITREIRKKDDVVYKVTRNSKPIKHTKEQQENFDKAKADRLDKYLKYPDSADKVVGDTVNKLNREVEKVEQARRIKEEKERFEKKWRQANQAERMEMDPARAEKEWKAASPEKKLSLDRKGAIEEFKDKDHPLPWEEVEKLGDSFVNEYLDTMTREQQAELYPDRHNKIWKNMTWEQRREYWPEQAEKEYNALPLEKRLDLEWDKMTLEERLQRAPDRIFKDMVKNNKPAKELPEEYRKAYMDYCKSITNKRDRDWAIYYADKTEYFDLWHKATIEEKRTDFPAY